MYTFTFVLIFALLTLLIIGVHQAAKVMEIDVHLEELPDGDDKLSIDWEIPNLIGTTKQSMEDIISTIDNSSNEEILHMHNEYYEVISPALHFLEKTNAIQQEDLDSLEILAQRVETLVENHVARIMGEENGR